MRLKGFYGEFKRTHRQAHIRCDAITSMYKKNLDNLLFTSLLNLDAKGKLKRGTLVGTTLLSGTRGGGDRMTVMAEKLFAGNNWFRKKAGWRCTWIAPLQKITKSVTC